MMKNFNFTKGFHLPLISFQSKCPTTFTAHSIASKGRWTNLMRKNASVTFTDTTKLGGTAMGMGGMGGGGGNNANATSVGLMSHSKLHEECNMEDDNRPDDGSFEADGGNEDNNANANASGATASLSFLIYLTDVEVDNANQQRHGRLLSVSSSNSSLGSSANLTSYHSTSINALQYYY